MADRISITVISLMALLLSIWSCSAAPLSTEPAGFYFDTTQINIDETTELVTELAEATTDSTEPSIIFPCPDCGTTIEVDAVTVQSAAESVTSLDLESVIIDLGVDRLAIKDPVIAQSAVSDDEKIMPTTEIAQVVKSSTEVQEKVEVLGDAVDQTETTPSATTYQEEISSTEQSVTVRPEADFVIHTGPKVDLKNRTKEEVGAPLIQSDPENVFRDPTESVPQKDEISADSETTQTATTSLEETPTSESATLRPETDTEINIVLKANLKTPSGERNEVTETTMDGSTIHPEFENIATIDPVSIVLKNDAQAQVTEFPTMVMDDAPTEIITSVPFSDENETLTPLVVEDVTQITVDSTDSGTGATQPTDPLNDPVDEVVLMEPQLVKIFDPSVDVEATTFLAEANMQTELDVTATTESFYQTDVADIIEEEETLTTTDESVTLTIGTESGTESVTGTNTNTELISETTTALPVNVKLSPPSSSNNANNIPLTKKRSYKGYKVYRVILPTEDSVRRILSMEDEPGVEFWADPRLLLRPRGLFVTSAADVMVAPKIVPEIEAVFREARLTYTVLIDDVHMSIAKENPSGPSFARSQSGPSGQHRLTWQRYHRLADINSFLDYLKETHPDWIQVVPIGKSSQGRPIHVIKLSRSQQSDGVEPSQKKSILVDAGMHANEWITPAALTWMINELVENADSYSCILDRFDWYFVPMVNPDGYEYSHTVDRMWRKTRRNYTSKLVRSSARKLRVDADDEQCLGADINRNFEFHWRKGGSSSNVCSPSFAGVKPFSEPESRALANFMLKQRSRLAMYISLHSYSQMWLLPWGFAETRPQDFSELYSLAKIGARALQKVHNTSYLIGSVPDLLALASGTSQDWAKGVAGVHYSYTLEMRDAGERGMILPAQQIVPTAEETWAGIYAASVQLAHRLYDELPSCSPF